MEMRADVQIPFPPVDVFRAYRDHLEDLLPYLPNVRGIEVRSRKDDGTLTRLVNIWRGGGEIPAAARAVLNESMLSWTDYASWDEARLVCDWSIETHAFTEAVRIAGQNRFVPEAGGTRVEIRGELSIDARKIRGVPGFMAGAVSKTVGEVLLSRIGPNLVAVGQGVGKFLAASGRGGAG